MSQYISFYVRSKHDDFIGLGDYSRSNPIYQLTDRAINVPYEHIRVLTTNDLRDMEDEANLERDSINANIAKYRGYITDIATFNNSLDEKMERVAEYQDLIEECTEELRKVELAAHYFQFLDAIIETNDFNGIPMDKCVYCGMEISDPTIDDIEK